MRLDRSLQLQILEYLRSLYPDTSLGIMQEPFAVHSDFYGNLVYLAEHGLLSFEPGRKKPHTIFSTRITHVGMDFLEQDGGINRILKTVPMEVINVHEFLSLLEQKVKESDLSPEEKRSHLEKVRAFSTPVMQSLLTKALISLPELAQQWFRSP